MPVFNNALAGAAGSGGADAAFKINRSLRFHADSTENSWLNKTFDVGNRKKFTISFWIKFTELPSHDNVIFGHMVSGYQTQTMIRRNGSGHLEFGQFTGSWNFRKITNRVFNDPSAWYHIVWSVDTTIASPAEDRVKLYVNGVRETSWSTNTNPSQNLQCLVNSNVQFGIGKALPVTQYAGNFYLADWHFVDGQALAPDTVFGEFDATTGVWNPIEYTGDHGPTPVNHYNNGQTDLNDGNVYLSTQPVENIFDGDDTTYSRINRGTNSNTRATFIWQPTGGISGVTKIRIKYDYCSRYQINNGTWYNVNNNGGYQEIYNGAAFTLTTLKIQRTDASGSDYGIFVYGVEINDTLVENTGNNGCHLDFSDNSSNGALGDDRNDPDYAKTVGALTTTTGGGSFYSNTHPSRAFDGNTSNEVYGGWTQTGDDSNVIWSPPSGAYSVNSGSGNLRVYAGYYSTIYVNGVSKATGAESSNSAWVTLSHTGAINSIKVENTVNDNVARISAIEINGATLVRKAWGVNNLVATPSVGTTSYDGGTYLKNLTTTNTAGNYASLGTYDWNVKAFDGQLNTSMGVSTGGGTTTVTWTPDSAISLSSFRFYMGNSWNIGGTTYEVSYNVNNTGWTVLGSTSDGNGVGAPQRWNSVTVPNNSLTSFAVKTVSANSGWGSGSWSALEIDGTILVENGNPPDTDSVIDSPSNYEADSGNNGGTYATLNPLYKQSEVQLANGNLDVTFSGPQGHAAYSTIAMQTGKYYFEVTSGANTSIGIRRTNKSAGNWPGTDGAGYGYAPDGRRVNSGTYYTFGTAHSNGDVIGVAFDADSGKLWFSHNGTWQAAGNPATGSNPAFTVTVDTDYGWYASVGYWTSPGTNINSFNAGQLPFKHTPPSGFKSLCTTNIPTPTVTKPSEHFDVVTYNGTGQAQSITGVNFQPDIAWIKERNHTSWHRIIDSVRGQKEVYPNDDNTENSFSQGVNSFISGGFTLGTGSDSNVNTNNKTYVGWLWKAPTSWSNGSGANGATLASSGKVNQDAGISIVEYDYTGTSQYGYAHGLNAKPDLVLRKSKTLTESWSVYHSAMGFDERSNLDNTNASSGTTTFRSDQGDPTSTLNYINNNNTSDIIEYVFTAVPGFSAFGRYEGTGTAEGEFLYCGFTPRWILLKNVDNASNRNWIIIDTKRSTFNINDGETVLFANQGDSESYGSDSYGRFDNKDAIDILSNGFRITEPNTSGVWTQINNTSQTHIWAAFADISFKYARAF